jgi:hypothetical protein
MRRTETHLAVRLCRTEVLSVFDIADLYICSKLFAFQYPIGLLVDEWELLEPQPHEVKIMIISTTTTSNDNVVSTEGCDS